MSYMNNGCLRSLCLLLLVLVLVLLDDGIVCLVLGSSAKQPYRTSYHFQPRKNYMNDPNGLMIYQGIYHLFYQYNPIGHGSSNGPRVWGHATSTDLINWAIKPNTLELQTSSNNLSSWSGSATILPGNKPIILFTGLNSQHIEVQNVAIPQNLSDPYLKKWVLLPQDPVISPNSSQNKIDPANFRDPTTAWILPDGIWRVAVGSIRGKQGSVLLFRSKDFIHWIQAKHPLYSYPSSGMWECPDFYPIYVNHGGPNTGLDTSTIGPNVNHVLKVSLIKNQQDVYTIGTYDIKKDAYSPHDKFMNESSLRYDYGDYYASKTFYDSSKKRRILFGWVKESLPDAYSAKIGWAGIQGFPRSVWLDSSRKQLIQWPVEEVETLRGRQVSLPSQVIKGGSRREILGITAAQADVEVSFRFKNLKLETIEKFNPKWTDPQSICKQNGRIGNGMLGPFGFLTLASQGLEEYTSVFFRIFHNAYNKPIVLMCSDQRRSSLSMEPEKIAYGTYLDVDPVSEGLFMRVLIDNSVIESFGGKGKKVITARAYPTLAIGDKAHLYIFNNGTYDVQHTGVHAWNMKTARIA